MAIYLLEESIYHDFGPKLDRDGKFRKEWLDRPHCDMCGPFRGRYLREYPDPGYAGTSWRCRGCDEEE